MSDSNANTSRKQPSDYINHPEVQQCLKQLKKLFGENYESLLVSDTLDDEGHQYVNLVQKGGGVLGVALVGYTYILETVGIRFLRLAGTSAGAINTAMLAVIGKKQDAKSPKILEYLSNLNFFKLVDGHPVAQQLIKTFITNKKFEKNLVRYLRIFGILFFGSIFLDILFVGLGHHHGWARAAGMISFLFTAILFVIFAALTGYTLYLYNRLKESGYGINPGNYFLEWMKQIMNENEVTTVEALNAKAADLPTLKVRDPKNQNASTLTADVTFISAELVSQNKVELPRMYGLFRSNYNDDPLHPAGFVRASMSIPVFFESYTIENIPSPATHPEIKNAWANFFNEDVTIPATARFVDGGMLSDFPINIFYNPKIIEPRLPSFGIDLDDSDPRTDQTATPDSWSLMNYLGRMFNTIRFYYDKDFLIKNRVFKKGIGSIPLSDFNWLNFFVSEDDKMKMFIRGAQAATGFLQSFKWNDYRKERIEMQRVLNEKQQPETTASGEPERSFYSRKA